MNDVERWADHEGPEPAGIKELMDAARAGRQRTPEEVARMRRSFQEARAAQRRKQARARTAKQALAVMFLVAAAAMVTLAVGRATHHGTQTEDADAPVPNGTGGVRRATSATPTSSHATPPLPPLPSASVAPPR